MSARVQFWRRLHEGLALKLAVCLVSSIVVIFAAFGFWNLHLQKRESEEMVLQSADRISDLIQRSTRYLMLHNNREALYQVIRDIGSEPGITRVRIFNRDGRISFSTEPLELGNVAETAAEFSGRGRILLSLGGGRVLAVTRPVPNQPACSDAACHAHPASQKVLGVIDAHLSLSSVDKQVASHRARLSAFTLAAVLLVCAISVTFVWAFVHRPFRFLISGTQRVAGGDLAFRIPITGSDEIGELAAAFNKMTAQLGVAHSLLEEDVESKTRELKRASQALFGSEKYAAIGKLAATVAHEVNNPLFGILTYSRLGLKELDRTPIDDAARRRMREQLVVIERESRRCGEIMKNLLTFARQAPRRRELARIHELIDRSLLLIRHQAELSGITLKTNLDPALPAIDCDAGQIQQVALVLLANACEAMPQGGVLTVTTRPAAPQIAIVVCDTGPGIPPDVLPHIFEPFYSTKDDAHRTGLGLAVAQSIVEQHGGSIAARTLDSGGAEFTVLLPVATLADPSAPAMTLTETHT